MRDRQPYYLLLPILNILVPQVGHTPWVAGRPFFIVISLGSFISLFALHFTQYASIVFLLKFILIVDPFVPLQTLQTGG
jgi:hypothetical protein